MNSFCSRISTLWLFNSANFSTTLFASSKSEKDIKTVVLEISFEILFKYFFKLLTKKG